MQIEERASENRYPLSASVSQAELDAELRQLKSAEHKSFFGRMLVYSKLGGPGFLGAATTLGAGTMTAGMLSGAAFGYKTLWIIILAIASSMFMLAAMARFSCRGRVNIVQLQKKHHGLFMGAVLTPIVGVVAVAIAFNFGQFAIGTHLMSAIADELQVSFPEEINWVLYAAITIWLTLNYGQGRRGTNLVEGFIKICIAAIIICFTGTLIIVGIDWGAALRGMFTPWLPGGVRGVDLFIASSAAAVGVMDWLLFHYSGLTKGWGPAHESLARFDIVAGFALPFLIINFLIISVFAATLYGTDSVPQTAQELSMALTPLLGETYGKFTFLVGFLAIPITTTIGMSIACGIALHEAFGWKADVNSWRWRASVLLPQIAFLGAWSANPIALIIILAAALSLTNNIVGWSFYLLLNDRKALGENRCKSALWNFGILVQVTLLNCVAISYVFNRLGLWHS